MNLNHMTASDLEVLLREVRAREAQNAEETDRDRFLAHLLDHRVDPRDLYREFRRIWAALDVLGVDLDAVDEEGRPAPAKRTSKPADPEQPPADPEQPDTKKTAEAAEDKGKKK